MPPGTCFGQQDEAEVGTDVLEPSRGLKKHGIFSRTLLLIHLHRENVPHMELRCVTEMNHPSHPS